MLKALFYAYVLGGITFIPLAIGVVLFITLYTSVPVGDPDVTKRTKGHLEGKEAEDEKDAAEASASSSGLQDIPRTRKGWLTMRRTFEETTGDGGYVTLVRSFLDSRSKDPKRSRPKDMWYVVLKGKVLYLYEDEEMTECEAAVELSGHQVIIFPEGLPDAELYAKRNAICLRPKISAPEYMASVTKQMSSSSGKDATDTSKATEQEKEVIADAEQKKDAAREQAFDPTTPWFIFVRSNVEMEDWYFALIHASEQPAQSSTLAPLGDVFQPADMGHLISILDEQPDVIPMRWLNALLGRIFFSHYRTRNLEAFIIGRLMKKLAKVKRPAFLTEIAVTQVSVGNTAPMLSKPMLKELTKEGDASIEVHLQYKGEIRITVEATVVINLGARFKSYSVKIVLAAVLKELEGNLLIKVKRPPSNRIWYAFTQTPRMVLEVEPIVSDRQITWGMILGTIESKFKEIIQESIVMPNMDDIAYFDTEPFEHRGGIWSDACRKPNEPPTTTETPIPDDVQSVQSAPQPETSPLSTESSTPTHSAEDKPASLKDFTASTSPDKRRSWFGPSRSTATSPSPSDISTTTLVVEPEEKRGRSSTSDKISSDVSTPRATSSNRPEVVRPVTPEPPKTPKVVVAEIETTLPPVTPERSRRASSGNADKVAVDSQDDESEPGTSKSASNTPRKLSNASQPPRPSSPPSFFSTLKAKAAATDKVALQNSAKEAMRKWGVNWGGPKKETKDTASGDETSQTGVSPPSGGLLSDASSFVSKARASYAEVKAAVSDRKERDRTPTRDSDIDGLPSVSSPTRARVVSGHRPSLSNGSIYAETENNPSIVTAAARLTAPKLSSKKSQPSLGRVHTEVDTAGLPDPEPVKVAPIQAQPQAKTMSIPGIHVSHRGELQSMGYVAPAPQPPPPTTNSVEAAMLKNPAIQSVYRLWKTPSQQSAAEGSQTSLDSNPSAATGDQPATAPPPAEIPSETESHEVTDAVTSSSPRAKSPSPVRTLVRPTPPPLPPRAASAVAAPVAHETPVVFAASDALKIIADKDESHRSTPALVDTSSTRQSNDLSVPISDAGPPALPARTVPVEGPDTVTAPPKPRLSGELALPSTKLPPPALPPRKVSANQTQA